MATLMKKLKRASTGASASDVNRDRSGLVERPQENEQPSSQATGRVAGASQAQRRSTEAVVGRRDDVYQPQNFDATVQNAQRARAQSHGAAGNPVATGLLVPPRTSSALPHNSTAASGKVHFDVVDNRPKSVPSNIARTSDTEYYLRHSSDNPWRFEESNTDRRVPGIRQIDIPPVPAIPVSNTNSQGVLAQSAPSSWAQNRSDIRFAKTPQDQNVHNAPYLDYRGTQLQTSAFNTSAEAPTISLSGQQQSSGSIRAGPYSRNDMVYSDAAATDRSRNDQRGMANDQTVLTPDVEPVDILASRVDEMCLDLNSQADTIAPEPVFIGVPPPTQGIPIQSGPQKVYKRPYLVQGAREPPSLAGIVDTNDSIDTTVHRKWEKPVYHDTIKPHITHVQHSVVQREQHTHTIIHRVQPVIDRVVLPTKHYKVDENDPTKLIEIPDPGTGGGVYREHVTTEYVAAPSEQPRSAEEASGGDEFVATAQPKRKNVKFVPPTRQFSEDSVYSYKTADSSIEDDENNEEPVRQARGPDERDSDDRKTTTWVHPVLVNPLHLPNSLVGRLHGSNPGSSDFGRLTSEESGSVAQMAPSTASQAAVHSLKATQLPTASVGGRSGTVEDSENARSSFLQATKDALAGKSSTTRFTSGADLETSSRQNLK